MLAGDGGQHGWQNHIRWICANGWFGRFWKRGFRGTRRQRGLGLSPARRSTGCVAFARRRARRAAPKVPQRRWKTMTFLAALRHDRIDAPWLLDGPINGERFRLYVEKVLVPSLRPGDIVVMDNLGSHKGQAVRQAIRAADAKLF